MKRIRLVVIFSMATLHPALHAQDTNRATVSVRVPIDARVYFDGTLMQQTGTIRSFVTPALPDSDAYLYEVKAEVDRQGQVVTQTQKVSVRAGRTTTADFSTLGTDPAANAGDDPAAEPAPAGDNGWPRKFTTGDTTLTVYQPQLEFVGRQSLDGSGRCLRREEVNRAAGLRRLLDERPDRGR